MIASTGSVYPVLSVGVGLPRWASVRSGEFIALSNPDNQPPWVLCTDNSPIYPAAIRELKAEGRLDEHCRFRRRRYCNNRIESNHRQVKRQLRAMQRPRTLRTARRVVKGIEAAQMIRKDQVLGITRPNLAAHAMVFGFLLGVE
jgi:transposase-like protein